MSDGILPFSKQCICISKCLSGECIPVQRSYPSGGYYSILADLHECAQPPYNYLATTVSLAPCPRLDTWQLFNGGLLNLTMWDALFCPHGLLQAS